MFVIVANERGLPYSDSEFPLISIGTDVDSGYIMERITYYYRFDHDEMDSCREYSGRPQNPDDFRIGRYSFLKKDEVWYYNRGSKDEPDLVVIAYGQKALEAYGSGEMFARLEHVFGGD